MNNTTTIDNHQSTLNHRLRYPPSATTAADTLLPMYSSPFTNPDPLKSDVSDLTPNLPLSRKRSRDSYSMSPFSVAQNLRNPTDCCSSFTFLGEDFSSQIQQQQLEIDQFVARHAEKLRAEIKEQQRRNSRRLITELEEGITQMLREKEDELLKLARLNWALEERVKSLCVENQIWRELAQTNEATANTLRTNLKQVLEQLVHGDFQRRCTAAGEEENAAEDAQSCCESNSSKETERMLAEQDSSDVKRRLCRSCGKGEACVLLLPCRHLCLCTVCASSVDICPVCRSSKNVSVHVHMS